MAYRHGMPNLIESMRGSKARENPDAATTQQVSQNEFEAELKAVLSQPVKPVNQRFALMEDMSVRKLCGEFVFVVPGTDTWPDTKPGKKHSLTLQYLDNNKVIEIGTEVFHSLHNGISEKTVAGLLLLAYNLRDINGNFSFSRTPESLFDEEKATPYDMFSSTIIKRIENPKQMAIVLPHDDEQRVNKVAFGFCYLACSYLRLYAKPEENYMKIEAQLRKRFKDFYGFSLPFNNFHPDIEAVKTIKRTFEFINNLKHTFYIILYCGESCDLGKNLKDFLYNIHVAYTGLHPFTLFIKVMKAYDLNYNQLAEVIRSHLTNPELMALRGVFENLMRTENPENALQMWKYARIFDLKFLICLQTKGSVFFTLVLASMLCLKDVQTYGGVMKIVYIEQAEEREKKSALAHARRAIEIIRQRKFEGWRS